MVNETFVTFQLKHAIIQTEFDGGRIRLDLYPGINTPVERLLSYLEGSGITVNEVLIIDIFSEENKQ